MPSRILIPNSNLQTLYAVPGAGAEGTRLLLPLLTPAVLVLHAWWGLDARMEEVCRRLASLGYAVLAPDLYGGRTAATRTEAEALRDALDRGQALWDLGAALSFLQYGTDVRVGRIGVLGFSLGGSMACRLVARRPAEITSMVTFYGLAPEVDAGALRLPAQGHFADDDEFISAAAVEAWGRTLNAPPAAGAEFHTYPGTTHGFFESPVPGVHHVSASRTAWDRTLAFFDRTLP